MNDVFGTFLSRVGLSLTNPKDALLINYLGGFDTGMGFTEEIAKYMLQPC